MQRQAWVTAALAVAALALSRSSGAGWLVVLAGLLGAVVAVGALWPAVVVVTARVAVEADCDARVGKAVRVEVRVGRLWSAAQLALEELGDVAVLGGSGAGEWWVTPTRRGVYARPVAVVSCSAPLGMVRWRRSLAVAVDRPLAVAPREAEADPTERWAAVKGPGTESGRAGTGSITRSVRPYVCGDAARIVHWRSSAHVGALMVRETEPDHDNGIIAVRLELGADDSTAEPAAERAAGLIAHALGSGRRVWLCAHEHGPVSGEVRSSLEAGRRLAAATPGRPASPPEGIDVVEVRG